MYFLEINYAIIIEAKQGDFCSPVDPHCSCCYACSANAQWGGTQGPLWTLVPALPPARCHPGHGSGSWAKFLWLRFVSTLWPEFFRCLQAHIHSHQWPASCARGDSLIISLIAKVNSEPILLSQTLALHHGPSIRPTEGKTQLFLTTPPGLMGFCQFCPGFISTFILNMRFLCFWNMTIITYLNIQYLLGWGYSSVVLAWYAWIVVLWGWGDYKVSSFISTVLGLDLRPQED